MSQRFNLKKILGYTPSERQKKLFYDLVVDKMVSRTASGKDIDNSDFTPYSEDYAKEKGVSVNSVDLIKSGDMLNSFEESQAQRNVVKVKIDDELEAKKAYNHNVGDTLPPRTFFGFKSLDDLEDVVRVVDNAKEESVQESTEPNPVDLSEVRRALNALRGNFSGFNDG